MAWILVAALAGCASPREDLARADSQGTIAAYEEFLRKHPEGVEAGLAQQRIKAEQAWQDAVERNTAASYRAFLADYPRAARAGEARKRLVPLEIAEAWSDAQKADTSEAYEAFLRQLERRAGETGQVYGDAAAEARKRLESARVREAETRWQGLLASGTATVAQIEAYMQLYPRSPHLAAARRLLEDTRTPDDPALLDTLRKAVAAADRPQNLIVQPGHFADQILVRATGSMLTYQRGRVMAPGQVFARAPSSGETWIPIAPAQFALFSFAAPKRIPDRVAGFCKTPIDALPYLLTPELLMILVVPREALPCEVEFKGVARGRIALPR